MNPRAPIVLLIEPDAIQSVTLARALKSEGYSVIPVRDADDALETFVAHHMDIALIVADIQSATVAGPPLLEALLAIDPWVPVVTMLSSGAMSPAPAIVGAANEYSNVAATLTKPVAPDDLVAHVRRVLQSVGTRDLHFLSHSLSALSPTHDTRLAPDHHVSAASTAPALCDWAGGPGDASFGDASFRDASFCWPPTDAELDEIHVLDTQSDRPWQLAPRPRLVNARVRPPRRPPALRELAVTPAPVEAAPLARRAAAVQLVIPPIDALRVKRGFDFTTDRWFEVAATALCGLALVTLFAVSGVSLKPAAIADNTSAQAVSPVRPVLSARRDHIAATPLVRADRVSSRFDRRTRPSDAFQREQRAIQPERSAIPVTARAATPGERIPDVTRERIPDLPRLETRTAAAAALPLPLAAARPPAPPAPDVEMAEARIEPAVTHDVAPSANVRAPAVNRPREDERGIYQVLQQYERAYERLDVDAARAVWPSLNTRALARAFDGLKEQALEFSHCRVVMESLEATAICGGRASYVPRVGPQTTRTEPREWTFRLRKVDHDWLIAKAEVR